MNRKHVVWISCLVLMTGLWWQAIGCGPAEVKPGEQGTESGGQLDAGETADKAADTAPQDTGGGSDQPTPKDDPAGGQDSTTPPDTAPDVVAQDNGGGTDTQPDLSAVDSPPVTPVKMEFSPKSGETIEVKDFCIQVTFSQAPSKRGWSAKWQAQGTTTQVPAILDFDKNDNTKATLCALVYLEQSTKYDVELTVKDASQSTLSTEKATYTTKAPYANEKPSDPGITSNMTLQQLLSPAGLVTLLGGLQPDQLVPILAHLYTKDSGNQGNLTYIGAAGKAPPGGKPHQGKDVVDSDAPSSALMQGTFSGRWFSVSSPRFFFAAGNLSLNLEQFQLTGITSTDGKRIEEGSFTAIVDAATVQKQFGLDICLLLVGECFKGSDGRDLIRFAGKLNGVANPLAFSAFLPEPQRLNTGVTTTPTVKFYFTEPVPAETDVTMTWQSCTGTAPADSPCDTAKGAIRTTLTVPGTVTLDSAKTSGSFTPTQALPAATWILLEISAKNASAQSTKTFTLFQTQ